MRKLTVPGLLPWIAFAVLAGGCSTLSERPDVPLTQALPPAETGVLAELAQAGAATRLAGQSSFLLLPGNVEALQWRLGLSDHATTSIDAQYFIWDNEPTSTLLFSRLLLAADRGVRVRLLVDDFLLRAGDRDLAAISGHPNFEIRLFNPGKVRDSTLGGIGEFLLKFRELNRRMHNKLFVVDGSVAIVGGRNVGDAYFGKSGSYNFRDLDVLTVGPVVEEMSAAFDEYWNAEVSYPGTALSDRVEEEDVERIRDEIREHLSAHEAELAPYPVDRRDWSAPLADVAAAMYPGIGHYLQDIPHEEEDAPPRLIDMITYLAPGAGEELVFVSPYFIPLPGTIDDFRAAVDDGVRLKIVTGSLGSNNHTIAHSHYKKYRHAIIATGAELYEFRHDPSPAVRHQVDAGPDPAEFVSLHVKAMAGDRERCFIGSLNLDPRALVINTENGLYIDSPALCGALSEDFDDLMSPENAWRVDVDENGQLRWTSVEGVVHRQPARGTGQRVADFFYRLLPVESQL